MAKKKSIKAEETNKIPPSLANQYLDKLIAYKDLDAMLSAEGYFRMSGAKSTVDTLYEKFKSSPESFGIEVEVKENVDVHVYSGLLKQCLIDVELSQAAKKILKEQLKIVENIENVDAYLNSNPNPIDVLLNKLVALNLYEDAKFLHNLFYIGERTAQKESINKMSAANVGTALINQPLIELAGIDAKDTSEFIRMVDLNKKIALFTEFTLKNSDEIRLRFEDKYPNIDVKSAPAPLPSALGDREPSSTRAQSLSEARKAISEEWKKARKETGQDWQRFLTDFSAIGKFTRNVFRIIVPSKSKTTTGSTTNQSSYSDQRRLSMNELNTMLDTYSKKMQQFTGSWFLSGGDDVNRLIRNIEGIETRLKKFQSDPDHDIREKANEVGEKIKEYLQGLVKDEKYQIAKDIISVRLEAIEPLMPPPLTEEVTLVTQDIYPEVARLLQDATSNNYNAVISIMLQGSEQRKAISRQITQEHDSTYRTLIIKYAEAVTEKFINNPEEYAQTMTRMLSQSHANVRRDTEEAVRRASLAYLNDPKKRESVAAHLQDEQVKNLFLKLTEKAISGELKRKASLTVVERGISSIRSTVDEIQHKIKEVGKKDNDKRPKM